MADLYWYKATCVNVVDGDTADFVIDVGFKMTTKQRCRFLHIDTPERGEEGWAEATAYVKERILGKEVFVRTEKDDSFGRYLALIMLDGVDVNTELVEKGYAEWYKKR